METGDANCDPNDESASVVVVPPNADKREAPESSLQDGGGGGGGDAAGDRSSGDAVARGISSVLVSVIRDFDSRAQDTLKSQDQLSSSIDRLTSGTRSLLLKIGVLDSHGYGEIDLVFSNLFARSLLGFSKYCCSILV